MKRYVADFETTTQEENCHVWAYATCEIGNIDNTTVGTCIDDFMMWCANDNKIVYFHNLKFDGEFIIHWLFTNGFTYSKEAKERTFSTVVSSMGQFYIIEVIFKAGNKKLQKVTFYDSLKKLPFPVKKIAKDFNLPIQKLEIDYNEEREETHILTQQEIDYVLNDVKIVAMALEIQISQNLTKITNGSDALSDFKRTISKKQFEINFPILDLEVDADIRQAYRGGFTYVNPHFQNIDIKDGIVFDVNSLYPSVMYDKPLPYGMPLYFVGKYEHDDMYPLYIQNLTCEFKVKKGYIPTIQLKNNLSFLPNQYIEESKEPVNLVLTSVDLELFLEHYEVWNIEYINGWKFKQCQGIFKPYIDKWGKVKKENKGAIRQLAKLMLNSLYGKFGTNPDVTGKIPYLDENNVVKWKLDEKTYRDPIYIPMGVFITAWARHKTITTAQLCYDRFIYADTDSLHLVGTEIPKPIEHIIDDKELGYWAHESTFTRARFIRQKTYVEEINGKLNVKCAGMPDTIKEKVTWETFKKGFKSYGKLLPKRVKGGIILKDTEFTLK
nr:MAG TPA: DNA polymerase B [Caudoviricetes sp.]